MQDAVVSRTRSKVSKELVHEIWSIVSQIDRLAPMHTTGTRVFRDARLFERRIEIGGDEPAESEGDQAPVKPEICARSAVDTERAVQPLVVLTRVTGSLGGFSDLVDVTQVIVRRNQSWREFRSEPPHQSAP
jgi:hypothetical protein